LWLVLWSALSGVGWSIAHHSVAKAKPVNPFGRSIEHISDEALGRTLPVQNVVRQTTSSYMHCAGLDAGYSFFAPNVPDSYKVVFEISDSEGNKYYDLPHISRRATAVRLATVLGYIGRNNSETLRELMLKMLTIPIAREYPAAQSIRTIFGYIEEPTIAEARDGHKESYRVICAFDFRLSGSGSKPR
jgi:hypothetical protein